jgi:hypothetical protein
MKRKTKAVLEKELEQAQSRIQELENRLRKYEPKPGDRPHTIDGWNVVKSGGYFRLFKKFKGKTQGIYIGKKLDEDVARKKIKLKTRDLKTANNTKPK